MNKRVCLVLGGALSLIEDVKQYKKRGGTYSGVVACNNAGYWWPDRLDAWVSLHPDKFDEWLTRRRGNGYPDPGKFAASVLCKNRASVREFATRNNFEVDYTDFSMHNKRTGSSGMFAMKYALMDLGFDVTVLCGIPLTKGPHFDYERLFKPDPFMLPWKSLGFETAKRIRSMSGWTKEKFGEPEWLSQTNA